MITKIKIMNPQKKLLNGVFSSPSSVTDVASVQMKNEGNKQTVCFNYKNFQINTVEPNLV